MSVWKRLIPRTLMGRAMLIVVTPLILVQLLSAYMFYESHWDQVSKRLALGLAGEVALLVDTFDGLTDPGARSWMFETAAARMELTATMEPGGVLPNGPPGETNVEGELRRALVARSMTKPVRVDSRSDPRSILIAVQLPEGVLRLSAPRGRLVSWTTYVFVLWTVGTSLILLGIATLFMRSQVRPVRRLALAADAFGKGRDVENFKPEGAREVKLAALAFLAMRNRILRQINQRTAMLAGVSHDLRTPLTRMKLQLEMMAGGEDVQELKDDITEMERMLEGYLAFARGEGTEKPTPQNLGQLLQEAVRQARRKGGEIELATEGDLELPLRPNAIRRCVTNLIENAMRYASRVVVRAKRRGGDVEVLIDDDGPGIPSDQREDVFKPFFRLEGSRNPVTGGVGLGLTIARDVARGHGGDILLDTSPAGGLRVRLRLPI
jgi:two-component system osmolarity sensor histidine kinase EnvZ